MSEGYWWAAYVLAGIIVVILVFKFYEHQYKHHMDQSEKRDFELMYTAMQANPGAKAIMLIFTWLIWPLITLFCIGVGLVLAFFAAWDGVDWIIWKGGKVVRSYRLRKRGKMGS